MRAHFEKDSVTLIFEPREFGFVVRCVNDRIHSLPEDEIGARLGLPYEDARRLLDAILAAEVEARSGGQHWLPPRARE
jgi:hypothetical protein